jgi:hypothetical protein
MPPQLADILKTLRIEVIPNMAKKPSAYESLGFQQHGWSFSLVLPAAHTPLA